MSRAIFPWTDDVADQLVGVLPHIPDTLDGVPVYRVPLSNRPGTFATLCKAGFDLLAARGVRFLIGNETGAGRPYVKVLRPGHLHKWDTAARLIANPGEGQWVRYANRDQTDLRLSNLSLYQPKARAA